MRKATILLFAFLLAVSISSTQALAAEWLDFKSKNTDELQKEWKITFSSTVDETTVGEKNVYVEDGEKNVVDTKYRVEDDKIFIKPVSNYIPGQTYTLYIGPGIKSDKRKDLKSDVRFKFSVNEMEPSPDPKPQPGLEVKPGAPSKFKNCTEMRKYYPDGVKVGHPAYEKKHDRDGDGWACE